MYSLILKWSSSSVVIRGFLLEWFLQALFRYSHISIKIRQGPQDAVILEIVGLLAKREERIRKIKCWELNTLLDYKSLDDAILESYDRRCLLSHLLTAQTRFSLCCLRRPVPGAMVVALWSFTKKLTLEWQDPFYCMDLQSIVFSLLPPRLK